MHCLSLSTFAVYTKKYSTKDKEKVEWGSILNRKEQREKGGGGKDREIER